MLNDNKKEKININIGLDIGVASVGWAILNNDSEIIDMGSRLFKDAAEEKDGSLANEKRRSARHMRRRLRRIRVRKNAFIKLIVDHGLVENKNEAKQILESKITNKKLGNNIVEDKGYYWITDGKKERLTMIEAKVMGLTKKLPKDLLISVLFHYLKHRGFFYEIDDENNKKTQSKQKGDVTKIWKPDPKLTPSENQLDFFKQFGYYMGAKENASYQAVSYMNEIDRLLKCQDLKEEFCEKYKKLFITIRKYYEGPGGEKSPTRYGLYRFDKTENKVIKHGDNLWDETVGKCTVYPEDNRGGKHAPKAELFNFLNDLNNLYIDGDRKSKLSKELKKEILDKISLEIIDPKKNKFGFLKKDKAPDSIIEWVNKTYPDVAVSGFRVSIKNDKKIDIITPLDNLVAITRWLHKLKLIENDFHILSKDLNKKTKTTDLDLVNKVFDCAWKAPDNKLRAKKILEEIPEIKSQIQSLNPESLNPELTAQDIILKFLESKKVKNLTQPHSFSYKAMDEYIEAGIEKSQNQMQFFGNKVYKLKEFEKKFLNNKYIDKTIFKDQIISPTTRRAFTQTINVLNKIIKVYSKNYNIDNITIELARDKNTANQSQSIAKWQSKNNSLIDDILGEDDFIGYKKEDLNNTTKLALKLAKEQGWIDLYDGEPIDRMALISGREYQIDHIIPWSKSFNDSFMNKTISKTRNNQLKGNKTPYEWLSKIGKYQEFKKRILELKTLAKQKKETFYLNESNDFSEFIGRNLVDTRYATRLVLNLLQEFFKVKKNYKKEDSETKVKVIRGSVTSYVRKTFSEIEFRKLDNSDKDSNVFKKNRDYHQHHAVDAAIIAFLGCNEKLKRFFQYSEMISEFGDEETDSDLSKYQEMVDESTGEVLKTSADEKMLLRDQTALHFKDDLKKWIIGNEPKKRIKFSRAIRTRKNIVLSDETIYSIRWNDFDKKKDKEKEGYLITKLSLLNGDKDKLKKIFSYDSPKKIDKNHILLNNSNPNIFNKLQEIWNKEEYKDPIGLKNPSWNSFVNFMKFMQIEDPALSTQNKYLIYNDEKLKFKIAYLKYKREPKKEKDLIILKNNEGVLENLNSLETRIYWNEKENKFHVLYINAHYLKSSKKHVLKIDEDKIFQEIKDFAKKGQDGKFICYKIVNGKTIIRKDTKQLYYFIGTLKIKPIDKMVKNDTGSQQIFKFSVTFSKKNQNSKMTVNIDQCNMCEVDELGKIYNEKSFFEYFELEDPSNTDNKNEN